MAMETQFPLWHAAPIKPGWEPLHAAFGTLRMKGLWHVWGALRRETGASAGSTTRDPALCTQSALQTTLTNYCASRFESPEEAAAAVVAHLTYPDSFTAAFAGKEAPRHARKEPETMTNTTPPTADDVQHAAEALAKAIAATRSQGVDEAAVAAIVDDRIKDAAPKIATAVGATLDQRIRDAIDAAILPTRVTFQPTPEAEARDLGVQHKQLPRLLRMIGLRLPNGTRPNIWITGPAGSGKTHAAHVASDALGLAFYPQGSVSAEHILFGFVDAGGRYHRTPFRDAWELGGTFCLDEADGCDPVALLALNAALANGVCAFPDGVVKRHADCVVVATANTWGNGPSAQYVGRARLDAASLNRFMLLDWQYDEALELALVPAAQHDWVRKVQAWRKKAVQIGANVLITPRASLNGATDLAAGATLDEAVSACFGGIDADTRRRIGILVAA